MYIYIYIYIYIYKYIYIYDSSIYLYISIYVYINILYMLAFKRKMEAQAIFLNSFNVCSLCKRKFVICSFVYKEIKGSYPLAMD